MDQRTRFIADYLDDFFPFAELCLRYDIRHPTWGAKKLLTRVARAHADPRYPSGELWVRGCVGFSMEYESRTIEDHYLLDLQILANYPESPPFVFEPEGKIPKDFDHFMVAGNFCLGAPIEVRRRFAGHKNLLRFIEDQVIPYLFSYSYKRVHGELPFGDLRHGTEGLRQYYTEFFGDFSS